LLLPILLLCTAAVSLSAQTLRATVDRQTVPVGESVTLSLIFEGLTSAGAPNLPPIPNMTLAPGISQRSEINIDNGRQSMRLIYDYQLTANQPGDVTIPAFQVSVGGKTLVSQPVPLKILPASAAAAAAQAALTNLAFIKLIVPKTEVYVGEPFPVEMQLYWHWQSAKDIHFPQLRADGFSTGQGPKPAQTRTQVGNAIYYLAIFKLTATAAKAGALTLGPAETSLTILTPISSPQRSRDAFERFFGGSPQYKEQPITVSSEAIAMRVLPLPTANAPENFNGAIGSYQMKVTAALTNVGVGDPITVRIQIAGRGPLDSLTLPAQTDWRDFNTYPPTSKVEANDDLGLQGMKSFEQVVIPQNHEIKALPPFRFSFFDPQAKAYVTRESRPIPLTVRPTAIAAPPPPTLTNANAAAAPPVDDVISIRHRLDLSGPATPLLAFQPWFLGLQGAPAILWLTLLIWRKRSETLANNPKLRRLREVAQREREGLKELRAQAAAQKSDDFFATLFRLLQERLGQRLDLPASAITEAVIDERLRGRGLPDETLQSLHGLFQTCNLARYAPIKSSQELSALIPKLEGALRDLQKLA
jgi:hypothetical protein